MTFRGQADGHSEGVTGVTPSSFVLRDQFRAAFAASLPANLSVTLVR